MGFLDRLLGNAQSLSLPKISALGEAIQYEDLRDPRLALFLSGGRAASSGVYVSERLALRNSAIYRSMSLISGAVGMLPIHLMRRTDDDDAEKARDHPLFSILHIMPNDYQTASEFKSFMQYSALADGNAFALIIRNARNQVISLVPLKRGSVEVRLSDTWQPIFKYNKPAGGAIDLTSQDVFHFRSPITVDGLHGLSLFDMAAEAIGIAVQAEKAAAKLFKNGSFASGTLSKAGTLTEAAYDRLKAGFAEAYAGAENSGKPMILEDGLAYQSMGSNAREAQHLETRKFQAEEVARITGVPRPLLMFDETSWGSGIEQLGQFFITYCLQPWLTAWEEAIYRSCLLPSEQGSYFAKFNAGALLRGSLKDQADFLAKALGSGGSQAWMTPNEARENFDMNDIDGGDTLPQQAGAPVQGDPSSAPDITGNPPTTKEPTDA
jgi:HK97 family phage portal protein